MAASDADDKIRLGGMALLNGVLVHGPTSWACAVRTPEGELKVAAEPKRVRAADVRNPLLRGPARLAEVFAVFPALRRRSCLEGTGTPARARACGGPAGRRRRLDRDLRLDGAEPRKQGRPSARSPGSRAAAPAG